MKMRKLAFGQLRKLTKPYELGVIDNKGDLLLFRTKGEDEMC